MNCQPRMGLQTVQFLRVSLAEQDSVPMCAQWRLIAHADRMRVIFPVKSASDTFFVRIK